MGSCVGVGGPSSARALLDFCLTVSIYKDQEVLLPTGD